MKKTFQHNKSILTKMMFSMLLTLVLMFMLLSGTIFFGGMTRQLRTNAFDILNERVSGRRDNLGNGMVQRWSNLGASVQNINQQAIRILEENDTDYSEFTAASPLSGKLLDAVSEHLIDQLRRSSVTGIFLILNGEEESTAPVGTDTQQRAGIYLRDYDPDTSPADHSDLMLERAPMAFFKHQNITLDTYWQPIFTFHSNEKNDYYYMPYRAALASHGAKAEDLGYWGAPHVLDPNGTPAITYSLPLLTEDGTPYGVLGVEMTLDCLAKLLPYTEINGDLQGSYVLTKRNRGISEFEILMATGPYFKNIFGSECDVLTVSDVPVCRDSYKILHEKSNEIYGCVQNLNLYNSNTPFESEQWALIGIIQDSKLLRLYHSVLIFLVLALLVSFFIGMISVVLNSLRLTRPITQLARKVRESDPNRPVLLGSINMVEIDELSSSIETLSHSVAESYSTLSKIMTMAGYRVGAFEYSPIREEVRYTDAFFGVLGISSPTNDRGVLPVAEFRDQMEPLSHYPAERQKDDTIYQLPTQEKDIWVRMQVMKSAERILGVVSDVTTEVLQRKRLEYERDYDSLTMLQNRRAFQKQVGELMKSEKIQIAAMVMMDLDNLKYINDTYGHDTGDAYLYETALVLRKHTSKCVLTARMSGDEFYVFICGENHDEIAQEITAIEHDLRTTKMHLPDGAQTRIRVSAGISWYPQDAAVFSQLIRYADFAMYRVKHTTKGRFSEFNQDNYDRESFLLNNKEELNRLIEEQMVRYDFQAIVDAHDGSIFAYEALMRPTSPLFASPLDVLAVAHSQSKLYEIERLTLFKAVEAFAERSPAQGKEKLFLNSIPNQILDSADITLIEKTYGCYLSRIVVELTEEEKPDGHITRAKSAIIEAWNAQVALDDFGSGYNGEATLLSISPDYLKIDQGIVRNLDQDENRRQIVKSIMEYADRYHIAVIGEGVETQAEMEILLAYGVQYLQGYYLAYPSRKFVQISEKVRHQIIDFQCNRKTRIEPLEKTKG